MSGIFSNVVLPRVRKSVFDLSYENKLSFNMGDLVPVYTENVVPGDRFRVNSEVFLRFAPMLAPIMHRVNCYVHYFFVPYRLIWDDWKEFITGGEDGLSQPVFPRYPMYGSLAKNGTLPDYLGYNFSSDSQLSDAWSAGEYSLLPLRAYQMIYNEYYRDQNLTQEVQFSKASGEGNSTEVLMSGTDYNTPLEAMTALCTLHNRAWEKDYFTSALPFVQRGVAARVPIDTDEFNLSGEGTSLIYRLSPGNTRNIVNGPNNTVSGSALENPLSFNSDITATVQSGLMNSDGTVSQVYTKEWLQQNGSKSDINLNGTHGVSLSDIASKLGFDGALTGPTINELRLSNHIQKWLEINARVGSRYIEQILGHYGVRVPDYRLDRPEYLGGGKSPVQISEVLQTSSTDDVTPQGNMSGHAYSVGNKNQFKYSFDEHGIVLGILSVLPRTAYQQGISRFLKKYDKFDHYFPEFAHLGEQAIKKEEIFNDFNNTEENESDWGYQERFAEYKYRSGEVHGDFRDTLNYWHLGRIFDNAPSLNTSFVESNPSSRIFNVQTGQHLWCQIYNGVSAVRPMPRHAIPSL